MLQLSPVRPYHQQEPYQSKVSRKRKQDQELPKQNDLKSRKVIQQEPPPVQAEIALIIKTGVAKNPALMKEITNLNLEKTLSLIKKIKKTPNHLGSPIRKEKSLVWQFQKKLFEEFEIFYPSLLKTNDYSAMLKLAGMNDEFQYSYDIYQKALKKTSPDSQFFSTFIFNARKNGDLERATEAYDLSKKKDLCNSEVIEAYRGVKRVLDSQKKTLLKKKQNKQLDEREKVRDRKAEKQEPNPIDKHTKKIKLASENGNFRLANEIYLKALAANEINSDLFHNFICAATKHRRFDLVESAYNEAEWRGHWHLDIDEAYQIARTKLDPR